MALLLVVVVMGGVEARASDDPALVALAAADMDACVGLYRGMKEPDVVNSVYRVGDKLYFEGERSAQLELLAESKDHFFVAGSTLRFTCNRGDDGIVKSLSYSYVGEAGGGATLMRFSHEGEEAESLSHLYEERGDDADAGWETAACGDTAARGFG